MATAETPATLPSMNEASERDPFNNNCYGTLVDFGEHHFVDLIGIVALR